MCILQSSFNRWRNYKKTNQQKPHNNCAEYHTCIKMVLQAYRKKKKVRETLTSFSTVSICKTGFYKGDKAISVWEFFIWIEYKQVSNAHSVLLPTPSLFSGSSPKSPWLPKECSWMYQNIIPLHTMKDHLVYVQIIFPITLWWQKSTRFLSEHLGH